MRKNIVWWKIIVGVRMRRCIFLGVCFSAALKCFQVVTISYRDSEYSWPGVEPRCVEKWNILASEVPCASGSVAGLRLSYGHSSLCFQVLVALFWRAQVVNYHVNLKSEEPATWHLKKLQSVYSNCLNIWLSEPRGQKIYPRAECSEMMASIWNYAELACKCMYFGVWE